MVLENLTESVKIEEYHRHERLLNKWYREDINQAMFEGKLIAYGLAIAIIGSEIVYALIKGV